MINPYMAAMAGWRSRRLGLVCSAGDWGFAISHRAIGLGHLSTKYIFFQYFLLVQMVILQKKASNIYDNNRYIRIDIYKPHWFSWLSWTRMVYWERCTKTDGYFGIFLGLPCHDSIMEEIQLTNWLYKSGVQNYSHFLSVSLHQDENSCTINTWSKKIRNIHGFVGQFCQK